MASQLAYENFSLNLEEIRGFVSTMDGKTGSDWRREIQNKYSSIQKFCELLFTSPTDGLNNNDKELVVRRQIFGRNFIEPKKSKSFLRFLWEACHDLTLIILSISAVVSFIISFTNIKKKGDPSEKQADWLESASIVVAVVVIATVTAICNWSKERQFKALQRHVEERKVVAVVRLGSVIELATGDLVVGDVCLIKYGDMLPADGLLLQANDLKVDESSMTGEVEHVIKSTEDDILLRSGTKIMEGSGRIVVVAVGVNTQFGKILQLSTGNYQNDNGSLEEERSILGKKLDILAKRIGYFGMVAAVLTFCILVTRYSVERFYIAKESWSQNSLEDMASFLIISITVLVVAIPEGLPLAVMLSLAYAVKKMMGDKNLVRHLDACETMGNATCVCSDKTGTLTANRMTVVSSYAGRKLCLNKYHLSEIKGSTRYLIAEGLSVNTGYTSQIKIETTGEDWTSIGNRTECSLLKFVNDLNMDYNQIRSRYPSQAFFKVYTFNSIRKYMATAINIRDAANSGGQNFIRLHAKGAAEVLLNRCEYEMNENGECVKLDLKGNKKIIDNLTKAGERTLCIAYRDILANEANLLNWDNEDDVIRKLVCIAIIGIADPVRPEVPLAIKKCQSAGIQVKMVTGDNVETAVNIAIKCGIIYQPVEGNVFEGPEFNRRIRRTPEGPVDQTLLDELWPRLRVLARSSPTDKFNLVRGIIESRVGGVRQVVAVTGDGTNDGPALKKADVGFAMGISGTDVAKEASDIILVDDNFSSIVKAVMWGRHVYDAISKFIQFQLTVNVVAVSLVVVSALFTADTPLKAIQMMWVNLLQDTLASLSFATEPPSDALLRRKPYDREASIITPSILHNIILHFIYQLTVLLAFLFAGDDFLLVQNGDDEAMRGIPNQHFTFVFNCLVMMTLANQFNCRRLADNQCHPFYRIYDSKIFCVIWTSSFIAQIIIIQWGGYVMFTVPLSVDQWFWCLFFALAELILSEIIELIEKIIKNRTVKFNRESSRVNSELNFRYQRFITQENEEQIFTNI